VPPPIRQMRQPRLADMVAGVLRERIVHGDLADGDMLPPLDRLVKEFGVSAPSLREALRVLESEGLITVRRGSTGGAVVHRPKAEAVAYMLGLVLQAERAPVTDLVGALGHLEPLCARLCAERSDRRGVVNRLGRSLRRSELAIDDPLAFEPACHNFHDELVAGCGNRVIILTVSTFESLWHKQEQGWGHRVSVLHEYPDIELRRAGVEAHQAILQTIERGDAEDAERLVRDHHEYSRIRSLPAKRGATVKATEH
jgi:GntR family transcriptional regulator, transcriptional repressor for pyruvate dehydrogenase complex